MSKLHEASLKKVAYNTTYYTISSVLLRASSIIFFPIFSSYLTLKDYGTLSLAQNISALVALFGGLGLSRCLTRFIYFKAKDVIIDRSAIVYTTLIASMVGLIAFVLLIVLVGPFLLKPILGEISFYPYIALALAALPLNSFIETARSYFIATHDGRSSFILDTCFFSTSILFNVFYVAYLGFDVVGIFLGILTSTVIFSFILIFKFYSQFKFRIDMILWKAMLKYALPLLPFMLLNTVFDSIDKFFLNSTEGTKASGIYYLAMTFSLVFSTFKESVSQAITPWVYENIDKNELLIRKTFNKVIILLGMVGLMISLFAKEFFIIFSNNLELVAAFEYIPLTIISFYIVSLGQLINIKTFYYANYNKYIFIATLVAVLVEIFACYFLIPRYSIHGAIFSRIIAFSVQTFVYLYFSKKEQEKKELYDYKQLFTWTIVISIGIWVCSYINLLGNYYYTIPIKAIVTLVICGLIYFSFKSRIDEYISRYYPIKK